MISDYDRHGCRSLDCGFVTLDCDRRGSLGCGGFVCVCVCVLLGVLLQKKAEDDLLIRPFSV